MMSTALSLTRVETVNGKGLDMDWSMEQFVKSIENNNELLMRVVDRQDRLEAILDDLVGQFVKSERRSRDTLRSLDSVRQAATRPILDDAAKYLANHQMSLEQTLQWLANGTGSLARFREREFRIALDPLDSLKLPLNCHDLPVALCSVLRDIPDNLVVGVPQFNRDIFWSGIWTEYWGRLRPHLEYSGRVANSHVTRPLAFQFLGDRAVELWRSVWAGRDAAVVTGTKSMKDPSPDLFDSARSKVRIACRNRNAFQDLEGIYRLVIEASPELALVSLGEAAPVLVKKLCESGIRAIDIGEVDKSFKSVYA